MTESGPYKMRTIARLSGFAPTLLRAWERRHGLLQPMRGAGGHRLYTEEDLVVLRKIRSLLDQGRAIGEIAAAGRDSLLGSEPADAGARSEVAPPSPAAESEIERRRLEIVSAARKIDSQALERALDAGLAQFPAVTVADRIIVPAAREIGRLWHSGDLSVAGEHVATGIFSHRVRKLVEAAQPAAEAPELVAACFPEEDHELGLLILCYELSRLGFRIRLLGAKVPFEDLRRACDAELPVGVLLSVTRLETYDRWRADLLSLSADLSRRTKFVLGGCGVPGSDPELERAAITVVRAGAGGAETARRVAAALRA